MVDTGRVPADDAIVLNETIHQPTRLRVMSLLVSVDGGDPLVYGFVQRHLNLTAGNLTTHLRKLEDAGYITITKQFHGAKPRTTLSATAAGRLAFAEYLMSLEQALGLRMQA